MQHKSLASSAMFATVLATSLLLGACNNDDDVGETPVAQEPTEVPATALASTQALVDWAGAQPASETAEPLDIVKAMPPVSDTDEPAAIR